MKKPTTKPKFDVTKWKLGHPEFISWWKNHWKSGFCEDEAGYWHWDITPWVAWESERFRAEFVGWSPDEIINAKIPEWNAQQKEADAFAARHRFAFSAKNNAKIWNDLGVSEGYMSKCVMLALDAIEAEYFQGKPPAMSSPDAMRAKIDEAYAYEPGQSKEETSLLERRRPFTPTK
jgi:hypothetical protein